MGLWVVMNRSCQLFFCPKEYERIISTDGKAPISLKLYPRSWPRHLRKRGPGPVGVESADETGGVALPDTPRRFIRRRWNFTLEFEIRTHRICQDNVGAGS